MQANDQPLSSSAWMSQKDLQISDAPKSETRFDMNCSDVRDFWDPIIDSRIDHIGRAPSPQRCFGATTIEALDEEQWILEAAMKAIRHRHIMEEQALKGALEILREHLECEERAIAWSIATIRRHRNPLVPVMRLPPEILSRIFVFHAQVEESWLNAALASTHVCKRWWEIGRACPELWSHINYSDCRSPAWIAKMIKRSRAVPLSLTIDSQAETDTQGMSLVTDNMHRFKSLDLEILPSGAHRLFKFSQPAPILQHLTLLSYVYSTFAFPPEFLGGSAPNLRHIKLTTSSYVPWDSTLFAHLVTLDVRGSGGDGVTSPPSLGMLLSALARMPGLETLILRDCFPPPTPPATYAHVDLSNLKRLEVTVSLERCTCFLRQITINSTATVVLDLMCSSVSREDTREFFTVFPSNLCTTSPPVAQALEFAWKKCNFEVRTWTAQQNTEFKSPKNACIKLIFRWEHDHSRGISPLDLTWACFAALASPQLHSFRVSDGNIVGWDVGVWRELARMIPGLQSLAPGGSAQCVELCKALSPPDGSDLVPADCCFPALSHLELEAPYDHPIPALDGGESLLSVVLARSLAIRASIGCSTPLLAFVASREGPPEGWSDIFVEAVPSIRVRVEPGK